MFLSAVQGIRDEIANRLNEAESDSTDQYTTWINMGIRDIARAVPNPSWLQTSADRTLSSGTRVYTNLPSDLERMNGITYPAGNVKMTYLEPEQLDLFVPSASQSGPPSIYTIRGVGTVAPRVEFYPIPADSYTIHYDYQKLPTTVSLASAVPDIPEKYLELLVLYGEAAGLKRQGQREQSREVTQEYETLKAKMIQDLAMQTNENKRIKNIRELMRNRVNVGDPITNIFNIIP